MENKYYTPSIEEFYVGFECEIRNSSGNVFDWEHFQIVGVDDAKISGTLMDWSFYDSRKAIEEEQVRVKYLDKQDIESLGWEFNYLGKDDWFKIHLPKNYVFDEIDYPFELWFKLDKYWLGFYNAIYKIVILEKGDDFLNGQTIRFSGNCPSINELKYIQKLLGIK